MSLMLELPAPKRWTARVPDTADKHGQSLLHQLRAFPSINILSTALRSTLLFASFYPERLGSVNSLSPLQSTVHRFQRMFARPRRSRLAVQFRV